MGPRNPNAAALLLLILMPGWNDDDRGLRKGVTNTRCVRYGWRLWQFVLRKLSERLLEEGAASSLDLLNLENLEDHRAE